MHIKLQFTVCHEIKTCVEDCEIGFTGMGRNTSFA